MIYYILFLALSAYIAPRFIRQEFTTILIGLILLVLFSIIEPSSIISLQDGYLGFAFFVIVMIAGAFKRSNVFGKKLRSVRKEYSILGFIALLPHLYSYFMDMINAIIPFEWFGIIAAIIMLPLFLLSIQYFKKKIHIKLWKKIQRFAYIAYLFMFIHVLIFTSSPLIYYIIGILYLFLKIKNYWFQTKLQRTLILSGIFILGLFTISYMTSVNENPTSVIEDTIASINEQVTTTVSANSSLDLNSIEDGTYSGSATGYHGLPVSLTVTITDGTITDITILSYGGTGSNHGMNYQDAAYEMAQDIIDAQSTDIDTISRATYTTSGILDAVIDALS
jgi:uncharacterized protein with FMN-binding domain/DMSO/TMAO reductase YedYZ heme-binding membrane subunit